MTVRTARSSSPTASGSTVTAYCIAQTTIPPLRPTAIGRPLPLPRDLGPLRVFLGRVGGRRLGAARPWPTGPGLPPAAASNRACGSPAHGSPTSFTGWHTQSWIGWFR
jgi:hypothetical protein